MLVKNNRWVMVALLALSVLTRANHFGDHVYLPDATLAVMLLIGLLQDKIRWFFVAVAVAFSMDFYALGVKGISDYCMSVGYWGLIPTYAVVWGAGRWLGKQAQPATGLGALVALSAFSIAFVLSNAFWYSFSDKVSSLSVWQFAQSVVQYYTPYVGYACMYLVMAWTLNKVFASVSVLKHTAP